MNRQQVWAVLSTVLLVSGLKLYGQQVDVSAAAAAKAAAGRQSLTYSATDVPGPKADGSFVTFDVPAAVNGTLPFGINPAGAVTGYFYDANFVGHGFLRASDGTFTTFDAPNDVNGTYPSSINHAGAITGYYVDANVAIHGFVRTSDGSITTFDAPGGGAGFFQGTVPLGINPAGAITGYYIDVSYVNHGFLRAHDGTLTTFDAPRAAQGTMPVAINPAGAIAGIYTDANGATHGFLRGGGGTFTTFDPPGSIHTFAPFSFGPDLGINPEGMITGTYFQLISGNPFGGNFRVFVRSADGVFRTFDAAAYPPCCIWSFPSGINSAGAIAGSFNDGFGVNHGFLRARDGSLTTFDVPGAGTGSNQGTVPLGINPAGVITGLYLDPNYVYHGFLWVP